MTMTSFFDRMFGRNSKGSSSTAKDRLQFVLVHDRINLPPERMREMKEEILAVISKYVPVERDNVDIALEQRDRYSSKIVAEIPFTKDHAVEEGDENDDQPSTGNPDATADTQPNKPVQSDD